ncbi:MAG: hypothetical protein AAF218_05200 [Pseudomonadota bacterium]
MKLLLIAAAFLVVTIGLVLLQPGQEAQTVADAPAVQPVAPVQVPQDTEVSQAVSSPLTPVTLPSASDAVSRQLRQPIRLTDTSAIHRDLPSLTAAVLAEFGHATRQGDRLHGLLVQALVERQSNAYIDTLLNTAAARGEFAVPPGLADTSGRLDTNRLLAALIARSAG